MTVRRGLALLAGVSVLLALAPAVEAAARRSGAPSSFVTVPVRTGSIPSPYHGSADAAGANVNITNKAGAQSETSVAIDPTDTTHLLATSNDLAATMIVYESHDGGQTWVNAGLTLSPTFCYDPWLDFNAAGDAFAAYECSDQRIAYRKHGQTTWVKTKFPTSIAGSVPDRDMVVVDTNPASPWFGSVYVGFDDAGASNTAYVAYSRDGFGGWKRSSRINDAGVTIGLNVAVAASGSLVATWEDYTAGRIYSDRSTDGGATWGTDHVVTTFRIPTQRFFINIPPQPTRGILPLPFGVGALPGSAHAGRVYVSYPDLPPAGSGLNVYARYSDDGGATWSDERQVNDGPPGAWGFHNAIAVAPDGPVGISYYDTREDPTGRQTHRYAAFSLDGGESWGPSTRITTAPSDETGVSANGNQYGDYQGMDAGPDGGFYAVWADSRTGTLAEDLFGAPVASGAPAPSTVQALQVSAGPGTVSVSGAAGFGGQGPVSVTTDARGDGPGDPGVASKAGIDLLGTRAGRSNATATDLVVEWRLAELPASGALPEITRYDWTFMAGTKRYTVQAKFSNLVGPTTQGDAAGTASHAGAAFQLLQGCPAPSTFFGCTHVAWLTGELDTRNVVVRARVPLSSAVAPEIRAGSTLEPPPVDVNNPPVFAAFQAAFTTSAVWDQAAWPASASYRIPAPEVLVGIAPAGTDPSQVAFGTPAVIAPDGSFSAGLATTGLTPGAYDVWARACFGANCATRAAPVSI